MDNQILLNYINNGYTAAEMAYKLGIHDLDLYQYINKLKRDGYVISKKLYSDGNFKYKLQTPYNQKEYTPIYTKPKEKNVEILCMSDLHYTSLEENNEMIHRAYDYAKKNGIKLIFLCGDILHGKFSSQEETFMPGIEQIKTFLEDFPFDNDILIIGTGGDHDQSILYGDYIDPIKAITNTRHNIIIPKYSQSLFRIGNADIILNHNSLGVPSNLNYNGKKCALALNGHRHRFAFYKKNGLSIDIPTTSDIVYDNINGFVVLSLGFNSNHIQSVGADFITYINGKEVVLSRNYSNINYKSNDNTLFIEEFDHEKIINTATPRIKEDPLTLLDKANNKLNDTNNKLNNSIEETITLKLQKINLINENKELTSTIKALEEDKNVLRDSLNEIKEIKNSKIEELQKENKNITISNNQLNINNKELKDKNKSMLEQLKKYKQLLDEALEREKVLLESKTEVKEEFIIINNVTEKEDVFNVFKQERINEYKDSLKAQEKEKLREEFLQKVSTFKDDLDYDLYKENEEFADKMCDVMDEVSLQLSGEEEKKRILKVNKSIEKEKKYNRSQMTREERIEELKKKMASKKK